MRRFVDRHLKPHAKKEPEVEVEFLLTSLPSSQVDVTAVLRPDREYWGIEKGLHLRLDGAGQEDRSRVCSRRAAFNLCLFRRAAISFAIHWIQRPPNPRLATTRGFCDSISAQGHREAFSLVTTRKPSWLPRT